MYSRKIISNNMDLASEQIRRANKLPAGWYLKPSSDDQRAEMVKHFAALRDPRGKLARPLTREEQLWQYCEATLCKIDFHYFSNYALIEDWAGLIVPFRPNVAQRLVLDVMAEQEEKQLAQAYMFLKARQLGMTTLWQILLAHRVFNYRNVNCATGSAEPEKSRAMVGKLEFLWSNLPWWLQPQRTAYRAGELLEYGHQNSTINVAWGNQKQGIGRGNTAQVVHLSELASFEDPGNLVDASLMRTVHENPFSLLALESTAEGIGDWWHRTWDLNSRWDARGLARLKPIFLPWFVGSDIYPTPDGLRRRPIPPNWQPPEFVERHAAAAATYVANTPLVRRALGDGWQMPLAQKWYYFLDYEEHREKRQLHIFFQEMPSNPDEAFQNANPTVFSIETLSEVRNKANACPPDTPGQREVGVWQLNGPEVPLHYSTNYQTAQPAESLNLRCLDTSGQQLVADFTLDRLRLEGWPDLETDGKIYIWEAPEFGEQYGLGIDPSEGVGQDSSVIQVIKKATPWHPDIQVAEFASNQVAPHDLWLWALALAHYYTTPKQGGGWNWPLVVIETNIAGGDGCQTEMLKRGWPSFYQPIDLTRTTTPTSQTPRLVEPRLGWRTTRANRPKIISLARKAIRDGTVQLKSPALVHELATLNYNLDKQRIEASEGNHDDRFMALAILLGAWYDPDRPAQESPATVLTRQLETQLNQSPRYLGNVEIGGRPRQHRPQPKRADGRALYSEILSQ